MGGFRRLQNRRTSLSELNLSDDICGFDGLGVWEKQAAGDVLVAFSEPESFLKTVFDD